MDINILINQLHTVTTEREKIEIESLIKEQFGSLPEDERKAVQHQFISSLDNKLKEADKVLEKVDIALVLDDISKYVSLSAIASNYFGKSKEWLYQRIKGYTVNGKPASFTEEEKKQFQDALKDLAERLLETSRKIA